MQKPGASSQKSGRTFACFSWLLATCWWLLSSVLRLLRRRRSLYDGRDRHGLPILHLLHLLLQRQPQLPSFGAVAEPLGLELREPLLRALPLRLRVLRAAQPVQRVAEVVEHDRVGQRRRRDGGLELLPRLVELAALVQHPAEAVEERLVVGLGLHRHADQLLRAVEVLALVRPRVA